MELWFIGGCDSMLARCLLGLAPQTKKKIRFMDYNAWALVVQTGKFMVQCDCAPMLERRSETIEASILEAQN
jgi:hypothetical protein